MHPNQQRNQGVAQGLEKKEWYPIAKNSNLQAKSFLNSTLGRTGWELLWKQDNRSIILRRKVQPDHTTMQAWCSRPINDWSSLFLQHLQVDYLERTSWIEENLLVGRHAVWATVSYSIPRTTMQEAGPRHFWECKGRPNLATTKSATWRLDAQMELLMWRFCTGGESKGPTSQPSLISLARWTSITPACW